MADIKIDEIEYFIFLNTVKIFIDELDQDLKDSNKAQVIQNYLKGEFERRDMMRERKMYYDFYIMNRFTKPEDANKAYQKYKELKSKLSKK